METILLGAAIMFGIWEYTEDKDLRNETATAVSQERAQGFAEYKASYNCALEDKAPTFKDVDTLGTRIKGLNHVRVEYVCE